MSPMLCSGMLEDVAWGSGEHTPKAHLLFSGWAFRYLHALLAVLRQTLQRRGKVRPVVAHPL